MSNPTKVVFTLPTANTDGSALNLADISGVKFTVFDSATGTPGIGGVVGTADLNLDAQGNGSISIPDLPPGTYTVALNTEAVSNGTAVESAPTAPVTFVFAAPSIPNPPSAVSVV